MTMDPTTKIDRRVATRDVVFLLVFTLAFNVGLVSAIATEPNNEVEPSASSLLDMKNPIGRIGGYQYNGKLAPTPGNGSRFEKHALYGSAGNIVGPDPAREGSRFQNSGRSFQSRKNYDALRAYSEFRRLERENGGRISGAGATGDKPRLVVASPPERIPNGGVGRTPHYGRTREELLDARARATLEAEALAQRNAFQEVASGVSQQPRPNASAPDGFLPQQLWMRGRAPQTGTPISGDYGAYDPLADYDSFLNNEQAYSAGYDSSALQGYWNEPAALGGAVGSFGDVGAIPLPPTRVMTEAETKAIIEEYFELQILRSPDVSPLSPIQVDFNNGVVTLRGVVPTPSARVAAGNLLLADPRVTKVNNMTTYVREDDGTLVSKAPDGAQKDAPASTTPSRQ